MAIITEDFVSFETAKLLKEKGFNEKLLTLYVTDEAKKEGCFQIMAFADDKIDNNYSDYCYIAPTLQMAMKWLREVHKYFIEIRYSFEEESECGYKFKIRKIGEDDIGIWSLSDELYGSYEQACEAAIKYCLENLIK